MDTVETLHGSLIQHGSYNDRIYLMRFNSDDVDQLLAALDELALGRGYGKIFAKIPATIWPRFKTAGYASEAQVPRFFHGRIDARFGAKYFAPHRRRVDDMAALLRWTGPTENEPVRHHDAIAVKPPNIISCSPSDAEEIAALYHRVFKSYPFPIQQPAHIRQMMQEGVRYFCVRERGGIAAVAAAEIDRTYDNTEMTDFATLPQWRGRGLAAHLLNYMDRETGRAGLKTAYTIARAESPGMNIVFRNCGYRFAGLLRNNTQIAGALRSMTVWYKHL